MGGTTFTASGGVILIVVTCGASTLTFIVGAVGAAGLVTLTFIVGAFGAFGAFILNASITIFPISGGVILGAPSGTLTLGFISNNCIGGGAGMLIGKSTGAFSTFFGFTFANISTSVGFSFTYLRSTKPYVFFPLTDEYISVLLVTVCPVRLDEEPIPPGCPTSNGGPCGL